MIHTHTKINAPDLVQRLLRVRELAIDLPHQRRLQHRGLRRGDMRQLPVPVVGPLAPVSMWMCGGVEG